MTWRASGSLLKNWELRVVAKAAVPTKTMKDNIANVIPGIRMILRELFMGSTSWSECCRDLMTEFLEAPETENAHLY
jgi:hypothetical protein